MSEADEGLMTHEEFVRAKEKMRNNKSLSLLEAGLMADHPLTCPKCQEALKQAKSKK